MQRQCEGSTEHSIPGLSVRTSSAACSARISVGTHSAGPSLRPIEHATGARRGSTARPVRESEPVRSRPVRERSLKGAHAQSDSPPSQTQRTALVRSLFITRVCKYPDPEARWAEPRSPISREKRRRVFPWIRTFAHAGRPFSLKRGSWRAIPPLLSAWCCSRRKKKKSRRWSAGVGRWRRYDAGEGVRWSRCCDAGEGVMWRLMRCGWRGGVVVEWWLSKITKVKEKRYLKITSPMNHM